MGLLIPVWAVPFFFPVATERAEGDQWQETPEVLGPGWHQPGDHEVPCGTVQDPPDAVDVSVGLTTRTPEIGERGTVTTVITSVRKVDSDGRPVGPSLVRPDLDGKRCVVTLSKAGTYQVTTESTMTRWQWVRSEEASSVSVERAHRKPLTDKTDSKEYKIFVRGDCSQDEIAAPEPTAADPMRDHLRDALLRALSARSQHVDENSVSIEPLTSGGLWRFAVRIGSGGCVLPSLYSMAACSSPVTGPATDLLLGSLQVAGGRSRINARIVDPWTSEVLTAARGDALGSDSDELAKAASDALNGLRFPWGCAG